MKNKVKLKKFLVIIFTLIIIFLSILEFLNIYEYNTYIGNYNNKINHIVNRVKENYPLVSNDEIMEILNNEEDNNSNLFSKYGIDIKNDSVILENKKSHLKFLILNNILFITSIGILLIIFLIYENKKDKEIKNITKLIEEINKKNYALEIDGISEDELSILKNELYKTMIMLKESSENSLKDKIEIKESLENISHQIKTPLTSILIMLDNLIDDVDMDSKTKEDFLRDIKREVMNINFLIQALLKLSKFDANTISFNKNNVFVKDIIMESVKNLATLSDLKNIKINVSGNENIQLKCDFRWQVEALTNIIKNSLEYSNNDSTIDIIYEQNNIYISVYIKDYGSGINNKDLKHIFDRFYNGINANHDSIGIGLALAKKIIENADGSINVESDKSGTKFTIKYFNI